jgi:plasmid stabilization system protein ParE
MTAVFRPEPEASAELEAAAQWYEERRSGLGVEFIEAFDSALAQIARWPDVGQLVSGLPSDISARRQPFARFPYHVVYLTWQGVVRVLAVAHDRRKPGYWFSRI